MQTNSGKLAMWKELAQNYHHDYKKQNNNKTKQIRAFCIVFHDIMLNCKMLSIPHANEWLETSNAAGNWHRQWITTDSFDVIYADLAAVKVGLV